MHNRESDPLAKAFNDSNDDKEGKRDGGSEGGEEGEDGGDEDAAAVQSLSSIFLGQSSSWQLRYHISGNMTMISLRFTPSQAIKHTQRRMPQESIPAL